MRYEAEQLLQHIKSPADLKLLDPDKLRQLAREIRRRIISCVSETGGHLAPNLGVVELTLGIHHVFDSPRDKIIWDVGHQSYTHKMISGRAGEFTTLRQGGGLSGFPKRSESLHDVYETGHSSTSVSAALGFALAGELTGNAGSVVAVIGDGALTGGVAYEGLNNAGDMGVDLTVVLNDNSMSISPNVGAMSRYLSRLRSDPSYHRIKDDIQYLLDRFPGVGRSVTDSIRRVKGGLKYLLIPGIIFEELGFTYLGPVDGHDIEALIDVLEQARKIGGPVLVHAVTVKGKGYEPAERRPERFHGVGSFDVSTGNGMKSSSTPTYTEVFSEAMVSLAERDERVVAITAAMPEGTGLDRFGKRFPERFFDVGIAEQSAVLLAAGLAAGGVRPVVAVYSTFLQRAYDQVVHDVAHQKLPVVLALDRAGIVGADGDTHQGAFDIAFLRHVPNMVVMAPRDENELRHMLATAVSGVEGPVAIRYPRGAGWSVPLDPELETLPVGRGELMAAGGDASIVALGHPVHEALHAREILREEGVEVAVMNARYAKPLDRDMILQLARNTPLLITVEEGALQGGFGSAVLELLADELSPSEMPACHRIGFPDEFIPHGDQRVQRKQYGLDAESIAEKVRLLLSDRSLHVG
ncbi:MAG: 1-deoxy-D-xylulose-5-phosphate synthase [Bacillota bacterium]